MTCRAALTGDKNLLLGYPCQGGLQIQARRNVVQLQQVGKL